MNRWFCIIGLLVFQLTSPSNAQIPVKLKCLMVAYPGAFQVKSDGNTLVWPDGTLTAFDDFIRKDFKEALENPAIADIFYQPYPVGFFIENGKKKYRIPSLNEDPGRFRNEDFYKKLYGSTQAQVTQNLVKIQWQPDGTEWRFQKRWGAAEALQRVSTDLKSLVQAKPEMKKFVEKLGGTFMWRTIKDSKRLSFHSFGTAIDINPKESHYWEWDKTYLYRNRIPIEIVEIFEKHGFIWGGKWYHYDTMHFEYRPELMLPASRCQAVFARSTLREH